MYKIILVIWPNVELSIFHNIVKNVNQVDSKSIQPISKLAELVTDSLYNCAFEHLTLTFYFELPFTDYVELTSENIFTISANQEGFFAKGYITTSFSKWKEYLRNNESYVAKAIAAQVKNFTFFQSKI